MVAQSAHRNIDKLCGAVKVHFLALRGEQPAQHAVAWSSKGLARSITQM
jgi:hypothetical protein